MLQVTITRTFDAPPERVFAAWTEPDLLARWVWAGIGRDPIVTADVRIGGDYRASTHVDGEAWSFCGTYQVVEPARRLACTLLWEADVGYPPGEERLDVRLGAVPGGTEMQFTHAGIPDERSVQGHAKGWNAAFDGLGRILSA